jgi:carbonic anhydrase
MFPTTPPGGGRLILPNPATAYLPYQARPRIHPSSFIAPHAVLTGDVILDEDAFIGFGAVIRGDWGPVYIGPQCNLHDMVTVHEQPRQTIKVGGYEYAVHLDGAVSVLHHSGIHGPCRIGRNTWIGQMVNIFDAEIGANCVIMHGALITGAAKIPDNRFVAAGKVIDGQAAADDLPEVPGKWVSVNPSTARGYQELGKGYKAMLSR